MEKKTKLDLIKEGYEAARDNKPEKKYSIGIEPNNSKHQDIILKVCKAHGIKSLELTTKHISLMSDCISEYIAQQATPQGIGWVKASERLPKEAGPITWRWLDKEAAYSGFNGTAFIYDKGGAQVDMLYAIEIEWLDEPNNAL